MIRLPARPFGLLLALSFCTGRLHAAERMTPGQWEFTVTTRGESRTSKACLSAEQAAIADGDDVTGRQAAERSVRKAKSSCVVGDFSARGDTVSYTLTCGDRTIRSVATHHGDHSEGILTTKTATEETSTRLVSRRLGACPK